MHGEAKRPWPSPPRPSQIPAPSLLDSPGEPGSPTRLLPPPLSPYHWAHGRGGPSLAILENPGGCGVPESPPDRPSRSGRRRRGERTAATGEMDPLCPGGGASHTPLSSPGHGGARGARAGHSHRGRRLAGVPVLGAATAGDTRGQTQTEPGVIDTSLYLYIRHRHRRAGRRSAPRLHFCSPHTEAAGVRCGSSGQGARAGPCSSRILALEP